MKAALIAVLMSFSLCAAAQAVTTEEPAKKPDAKKVEPKKAPPAKTAAPKKPVAPKKPAAPAKPASAPAKAAAPAKGTVYTNDPNAPILRDKDGNVIPTNPNAYDVSSAVGKKK